MEEWDIKQAADFQHWFEEAGKTIQNDSLEHIVLLKQFGPKLKRPYADTIKGSKISNLKELRFNSGNKVIRIFFLFDSDRSGLLLIGGNKAGSGDKKFYQNMIHQCEKIYAKYLKEKNYEERN